MTGRFWWSIYYRLREAREGIARNTWASLATVVLLTITLLLFGGFLWLNENLVQVASLLERQVQVRVFPQEGVGAEQLVQPLTAITGVRRVQIIDGESVYSELAPVFGQDALMQALPTDAFADSLSLELANPAEGSDIVRDIKAISGVGEVIWGQGFAAQLLRVSKGLQKSGAFLLGAFLVSSVLMSLTSMHLAVLNREVEIQIQRWVGVSPWGIRAQFLIEAFLIGFFASTLAGSMFLYLGEVIQSMISELVPFMSGQLTSPGIVIGVVLVMGPALALLGGGLASQRAIGIGDR